MSLKRPDKQLSTTTVYIRKVFAEVEEKLGEKKAKQIWSAVIKDKGKKPGRPKRLELSGWDALLLDIYDELETGPNPKTLIRHMARFFRENNPSQYRHATPKALERKIRRLLEQRKKGLLKIEEKPDGLLPNYRIISNSNGH